MEGTDPVAKAELPGVVNASPELPSTQLAQHDAPTLTWGRLAPFLAAIGTGIGVIGFVTFMGGMIVWARVRATGIPAAPTLSVLPKQDLLVIGAETLVPMVITALAVVIALAALYALLRALLRLLHLQVAHRLTDHEARFIAGEAPRLSAAGMFVFVFFALIVSLLHAKLTTEQLVPAIVVIFIGATVAAEIGRVTHRFMYLATATFILAGIFLGFVAWWSAGNDVKVRGAAIIRENRKAIAGIFVAENAGRVYLARLTLRKNGTINTDGSRLVGIAKTDVTDIAIADRQAPKQALEQARLLAKELCELQLERSASINGHIQICRTAPAGHTQP
jgi:hypothetical protein